MLKNADADRLPAAFPTEDDEGTPVSLHVPRGRIWGRMSDHLPLVAEFALD